MKSVLLLTAGDKTCVFRYREIKTQPCDLQLLRHLLSSGETQRIAVFPAGRMHIKRAVGQRGVSLKRGKTPSTWKRPACVRAVGSDGRSGVVICDPLLHKQSLSVCLYSICEME